VGGGDGGVGGGDGGGPGGDGGGPGGDGGGPAAVEVHAGEPSWLIVVAMVAGIAALVVLGVHLPSALSELLRRGASELRVPR
jgi:hypothetical protein